MLPQVQAKSESRSSLFRKLWEANSIICRSGADWYSPRAAEKFAGCSRVTLRKWRTTCPHLKGQRGTKTKAFAVLGREPVDYFLRADLDIVKKAVRPRNNWRVKLPPLEGNWLTDDIFQTSDGLLYFSVADLTTNYPTISSLMWHRWSQHPSADLGRRIRAFLVDRPEGRRQPNVCHHRTQIVWEQKDVELAASQRMDAEKRCHPPHHPGKWLSDELRNDNEFGVCARDSYLESHIHRHKVYFGVRRRQPSPALDSSENGGKPRWRRVPKRHGFGTVIVTPA
jgi:hypothetical protein